MKINDDQSLSPTMNTITFLNMPLNKIRQKDKNARALVKLINNNQNGNIEPSILNMSKSVLTFQLNKELSCRNFVILNHYRKDSVQYHLQNGHSQAKNLFRQVLLFGQEVS
jgi:hypothetical protein